MLINNTGATEIHWQDSHRIPACEMRIVGDKMLKKMAEVELVN